MTAKKGVILGIMRIVNEAISYHIEATYNKVIIIYKNDIMEILKINVYL